VDLTAWPLAGGFLVYLLAMDLGEYLFHRAQHAVPWLWAMHSLHHSGTALNVTTAQRHYWLERVLKSLTIWLAVALLFRVDAAILSLYAALSFWHFFTHANVRIGFGPLSWLVNSPQHHRLHHSRAPEHYNANYAALLPIFDVVSGAYRRPRRSEFPETGLDMAPPASGFELIVWPVRGLIRNLATAKRAAA
jgi:sterol desaturase/sphingolipid hydroxylase (fatty acid hydroxylase superfamily)